MHPLIEMRGSMLRLSRLATFGILACAMAAVLLSWIDSYWEGQTLIVDLVGRTELSFVTFAVARGGVGMIYGAPIPRLRAKGQAPVRWAFSFDDEPTELQLDAVGPGKRRSDVHALGFVIDHVGGNLPGHEYLVAVPHWFLVALLGLLTAQSVRRRAANRRHLPANLCASCGYDLRATPERCPECGSAREPS
jgi:hypothetical protein